MKCLLMSPLLALQSIKFFVLFFFNGVLFQFLILMLYCLAMESFLWLFLFAGISEINNFRETELVSYWFVCQGWELTSNKTGLLPQVFRRALIVSFSYSQVPFFIQLVQTWRNPHLFSKSIKLSEALQIVRGIDRKACTHIFLLNKPHSS